MAKKKVQNDNKKVKVKVDGFSFEFFKDVADDVEILDLLDKMGQGNPIEMRNLIIYVLGEKKYQAMKNHFVKKNGKMRITDLERVLETMFSPENLNPKE